MSGALLTWLDCSAELEEGDRIIFVEAFKDVPRDATGTVLENSLNEISPGIIIALDRGGRIELGTHLDPGADTEANATPEAQAWHALSPITLEAGQ